VRTSFDYHESRSASSVEGIFISGGASLHTGINLSSGLPWPRCRVLGPAKEAESRFDCRSGKIKIGIGPAGCRHRARLEEMTL
jgi:hypothetical protein